ncbi:HK97 family phage major capsid protein [Ochrobactrum sp. P20RRXII]|nr:phage major capsid protein [Ochrobactrum sp. P20RRXII]NIH77421.1 HK97 family phage major capsid protein [Ochrobactrum sp. P20RRXII]
MPLLLSEASKLSRDDFQRGVVEEIVTEDALYSLLPFVGTENRVYSYTREGVNAEGAWVEAYEELEESASTFVEVDTRIKALIGQVDMDNLTVISESNINDQVALQVAAKAKGMSRQFRSALINGSATTNNKQFDGIKNLIVPTQTLDAEGSAVTLAMLDELKDKVPLGADFFMMRRGTWRAIKGLLRAMGGNTAEHVMLENFGQPVPVYDGIPVLFSEFIGTDKGAAEGDPETTSIYAIRANEVDGVHGIFVGGNAGLEVKAMGDLEDFDAQRYRLRWYAGLALKATHSCARIKGLTNL